MRMPSEVRSGWRNARAARTPATIRRRSASAPSAKAEAIVLSSRARTAVSSSIPLPASVSAHSKPTDSAAAVLVSRQARTTAAVSPDAA